MSLGDGRLQTSWRRILVAVFFSLVLFQSVTAAPYIPSQNTKRAAPQVSLLSYTYVNQVLEGTIQVQNLAYAKKVTVNYATDVWKPDQAISATYVKTNQDGYEVWGFKGVAPGAKEFYIHYQVAGADYYDPGNNKNHQIVSTNPPDATPTSTTTPVTPTPGPTTPVDPPTGTSDVLLQGFHWTSATSFSGNWWKTVNSKVNDIKGFFSTIWLPPVSDAGSPEGYLPRQWNVLDTKYGSASDLKTLLNNLNNAGVAPVADIVVNHRVGTRGWADFSNPSFPDNNAAICRTDEWASNGGQPRGNADTGDNYASARDLDHTNPAVQAAVTSYLKDTLQSIGFKGWRYDFVKGFAGKYIEMYNRATQPVISVGELWTDLNIRDPSSHRNILRDWIRTTSDTTSAFDFTTKGMLQYAVANRDYAVMNLNGGPAGLIGLDPQRAVTFVDNHDTGPSVGGGQRHWVFPEGQVMSGYAYILTHPGVPSVYWYHYFDLNLKPAIDPILLSRRTAGINATSPITILKADTQAYAAVITGSSGRVAVKIGPGDWSPPVNEGFKLVASGNEYAVWSA
ncbi:glycoside hydrolase superfamily [Gaertneriomyces semiglobifer]|nr:glycoside hydrolase superfamily [Gaertneriomyces semiglobifer]